MSIQIITAPHRAKLRLFLAVIADSGEIITRRMLGSTLTPHQIAEKTAEFTAYWVANFRPRTASIVDTCELHLL